MDVLELTRQFRTAVPAPAPDSERAARRALVARFDERPRRLRRGRPLFRVAIAVAVVAVASILAASGVIPGEPDGTSDALAGEVEEIAAAAAGQPALGVGAGEYMYTRSREADLATTNEGGHSWSVLVPVTREVWLATDGSGRIRERVGEPTFLSDADRAAWVAAGRPPLTARESSDERFPAGALSGDRARGLPTDPDALARVIREQASGTDVPVDVEMFVIAGDLLRMPTTPPAVRAALYRVLSKVSGVEFVGKATDAAGRAGVALAIESDYSGALERHQMIVDPDTGDLLAEETVLLRGAAHLQAKPGTVIGYAVYLAVAATNGIRRP
ncbi:MAG: CU044_5270 family protein [Actinomycetota bacterium]|nr:CU044_5270 family protein [Actinomycetota bacterium]